jgi:hypothetical protein
VHVSVYVEVTVRGPVDWLPDVGFDPVHAPDATHDCARFADQVSVEEPLYGTDAGLALKLIAGGLGAAVAGARA